MLLKKILYINGVKRTLYVDPESSLSTVLRNQLLLTGCKIGCGQGHCGTCTVVLNNKAVRSCIVKMKKVEDESVIHAIVKLY